MDTVEFFEGLYLKRTFSVSYRAEGREVFWYRHEFDVSGSNAYASFVPLEMPKYVFAVVSLQFLCKQLFFSLEREREGEYFCLYASQLRAGM